MSKRGDDWYDQTIDWLLRKVSIERGTIEGNAKTMVKDMQESAEEQIAMIDEVLEFIESKRKR